MTIFAAFILVTMIVGVAALLERNNRHNADRPSAPYGSDLDRDADLWRVRHDLDVARPASSPTRGGRRAGSTHHIHRMRVA
jgi:hypothetical protein